MEWYINTLNIKWRKKNLEKSVEPSDQNLISVNTVFTLKVGGIWSIIFWLPQMIWADLSSTQVTSIHFDFNKFKLNSRFQSFIFNSFPPICGKFRVVPINSRRSSGRQRLRSTTGMRNTRKGPRGLRFPRAEISEIPNLGDLGSLRSRRSGMLAHPKSD